MAAKLEVTEVDYFQQLKDFFESGATVLSSPSIAAEERGEEFHTRGVHQDPKILVNLEGGLVGMKKRREHVAKKKCR